MYLRRRFGIALVIVPCVVLYLELTMIFGLRQIHAARAAVPITFANDLRSWLWIALLQCLVLACLIWLGVTCFALQTVIYGSPTPESGGALLLTPKQQLFKPAES